MLSRARAASDIRHKDAPAFRLKVECSCIGDDLEQKNGTFTEWWVSSDQWRRETESGNSRHLEIGGPYKIWLQDTGNELPEQVRRLPSLVAITTPPSGKQQFDSIFPLATNEPEIGCFITVDPIRKKKGAFCFHKTSAVMMQKIDAIAIARRVADYGCD